MYQRLFKETKIPKAPAYWINPNGKILPIFEEDKHIDMIVRNPEGFGLTDDYIRSIYTKYDDDYGEEGKAREEILNLLFKYSWIRIRYYSRTDTFSINIYKLDKKRKDYLYNWAIAMSKLGLQYSQVKLDLPNEVKVYSIKQITEDILFNESVQNKLIVINNVKEL